MIRSLDPASGGGHRSQPRLLRDAGLTLVELLIAMVIFGVLVSVTAAFMTIGLRTTDSSLTDVAESKDVQLLSTYIDADVQSVAAVIDTDCNNQPGETRLIGLQSPSGLVVYYASTASGTLTRRECGIDAVVRPARTLMRTLGTSPPTVLCDNHTCSSGSVPDTVTVRVTMTSGYSIDLTGTRRTFINEVPIRGEMYPRWGRTLTVLHAGSAAVTLADAAVVKIAGGVSISSSRADFCNNCTATSWIVTDGVVQQPLADPLSSVAYPDVSTMPLFTGADVLGNHYRGPGVYRFPVVLDRTLTLEAGVYVFEAGLTVKRANALLPTVITGTGVVVFNGCAVNSPTSCTNTGNLKFEPGAVINLTAPESGTYAEIVVIQARENVQPVILRGGGVGLNQLNGVVYLPNATTHLANDALATLTIKALIVNRLDAGSGSYTIGTL